MPLIEEYRKHYLRKIEGVNRAGSRVATARASRGRGAFRSAAQRTDGGLQEDGRGLASAQQFPPAASRREAATQTDDRDGQQ